MAWQSWFPLLRWWRRVDRHTLRCDALAGLTGGIILVPQGVAFATVAGMPPEYGLYAAMIPAIVAALWGSSWHLVSGPTTAISLVVFATISPLAAPGTDDYVKLVLTLTLLVGLFQLLLGLLRLGTLVNFVSHTVVVGFTAGAAILIVASQAGHFFGLDMPRGSSPLGVVRELATRLSEINPFVTAVALATVFASVATRRWLPRVPHLIVAMLVGSVLGVVLQATAGGAATGIKSIGDLGVAWPPLSMPDLSLATLTQLAPIAVTVAMLCLTEAVAIARAIALKSGQRIDGNQEVIGQGLANVAGAFFSAYASSGSFNRSGLNHAAGAQTPLAAVFSALFLLALLLFLAPWAKYLTAPVMAGILFVVAWGLIDFKELRDILRSSRQETAVLALTFVATLTLPLEYAVYLGVLLSLMLYLRRTSQPKLEEVFPVPGMLPPVFAPQESGSAVALGLNAPGLKIVRLNGSVYFGAVNHLEESLQAIDERNPEHTHVLLVASGINFIDLAGAQLLAREARRRRSIGGGLYLFNPKQEALDTLQRSGQLEEIGRENVFRLGEDVLGLLGLRLKAGPGDGQTPAR